jgi:vacuolar-type H+-ATPase subunit D/Vma8
MKGWKLLVMKRDRMEANVLEAALEEAGITTELIDKVDTAYNTFGEVEIYVREEDWEKAVEYMNAHKA